jgi:hypothetical protein
VDSSAKVEQCFFVLVFVRGFRFADLHGLDYNACLVDPCSSFASCEDNPPPSMNATCTCLPGYEGDGVNCTGKASLLSVSSIDG